MEALCATLDLLGSGSAGRRYQSTEAADGPQAQVAEGTGGDEPGAAVVRAHTSGSGFLYDPPSYPRCNLLDP
jgi:hypothetical protein